jgi:small-conductance mechanosensitive channel
MPAGLRWTWLDWTFLGRELRDWAAAAGIALLAFLVVALVRWALVRRGGGLASRTATGIDDFVVRLAARTRLLLVFFPALYLGSLALDLGGAGRNVLRTAAVLALLAQLAIWASDAIDFWVAVRRRRLEGDAASVTTVAVLNFLGKLVLWSVLLLLALDNLGIDVTALVTGLGVGGIAVALAMQNILGDLFSSLSIVLDKPFAIGDTIGVGDFQGKVETIGLKTTRLRSLSGEQLVFPNGDLLQSRIRNFQRMSERRAVLAFGVALDTPADRLEAIPGRLREIVRGLPDLRFDRAHLRSLTTSAAEVELVYFVESADQNLHMDRQQAVLLALLRFLEESGIALAQPGHTVLVQGQSSPPKEPPC